MASSSSNATQVPLSFSVPSLKEASRLDSDRNDEEKEEIDWENLGFTLTKTDYMYVMKCSRDGNFKDGKLSRHGNIELSPHSGVLNYGQGIFEGLKAYRSAKGSIHLFRPEENAKRMQIGAERMCMPAPSVDQFLDAVKQTVLANKRWVPPHGKGSLYIRPLLMGSGATLALTPAPEYMFLVCVVPVGHFFKEGMEPINLLIEDEIPRASLGGIGDVKAIGNYAPDGVISTPTKGTILPGVTRKSIMELAHNIGYQVCERLVSIDDLREADEVFCTGTAVVVSPVSSITYQGHRYSYRTGEETVSKKLYTALTSIQTGLVEDNNGWTVKID
ncbi:branched-chain-amino-acid aminotransferase 3, chloroplastic-like isoform X2 [Carex rostrata]